MNDDDDNDDDCSLTKTRSITRFTHPSGRTHLKSFLFFEQALIVLGFNLETCVNILREFEQFY